MATATKEAATRTRHVFTDEEVASLKKQYMSKIKARLEKGESQATITEETGAPRNFVHAVALASGKVNTKTATGKRLRKSWQERLGISA